MQNDDENVYIVEFRNVLPGINKNKFLQVINEL